MTNQKATISQLEERIASRNEIPKNKLNRVKPAPALTLRITNKSD